MHQAPPRFSPPENQALIAVGSATSTTADNSSTSIRANPPTISLPNNNDLNNCNDTHVTRQDDRLVKLFYENLHLAHPILVPSAFYHGQQYPRFLQLVVHLIGSRYLPSEPSQQLKDNVESQLTMSQDRSPSMVQACLLYAIYLDACNDYSKARDAFSKSAQIASELGMHRSSFASSMGSERSVEAESMRRTWWELYVVDVFMNISSKPLTFHCQIATPEVALPCEEALYVRASGIPAPASFLAFRRRVFSAEETIFPSFSYRIDAVMILCRVLVLNQVREPHRDQLQAVENALVSWVNHLPSSKREIIDSYGTVDEMMFQAHIAIAYAAMLLHLPRSELQPLLPPRGDIFWPCTPSELSSTFSRVVHSIKATEASRRVSDFVSICPNMNKHSPLITPALGLCGMIQLATSLSHADDCFDHHCNRVTLILGCLRVAGRTWDSASMTFHRVRTCAAEILSESIDDWSSRLSEKITPGHNINDLRSGNRDLGSLQNDQDAQNQVLLDLSQGFVDSACYDTSLFNSLGDFDLI
ncbi:hypothetical protein PFICI_04863 [Pestalotiopsis fici W106-1]|uniref:Xylanolytic transcriptional activator regulatory domain-containing protein n=1 Tax=Pestalotiopsis fici (strain W106-1 / CGMCC3.15140) TaxID=1229662 RepID=W3XC20_PESFW|nr:uncharacterized protein PFICI_04863 [Pestalotiopsis fici W106-1]ETS82987.1 hypothetical protein PFICI_04863 [Pestalotiopsis fici W106-1]